MRTELLDGLTIWSAASVHSRLALLIRVCGVLLVDKTPMIRLPQAHVAESEDVGFACIQLELHGVIESVVAVRVAGVTKLSAVTGKLGAHGGFPLWQP